MGFAKNADSGKDLREDKMKNQDNKDSYIPTIISGDDETEYEDEEEE